MLKYLRLLILVGFRILFVFTFYIWRYARHPERYPLERRYQVYRKLTTDVMRAFRVEYNVENLENFANRADNCVVIANHLSMVDPLLLSVLSEKPITFIAKKETLKMPFIGKALKSIDGIFLDRDNLRKEVEQINHAANLVKTENITMCIFPEGTRNKEPGTPCKEFHPGSLKVAYKSNAQIIPVAIYGTWRVFSGKIRIKKFPCFFHFYEPISVDDYKNVKTTDLAKQLETKITAKLEDFKKDDYKKVSEMKMSKKKKAKLLEPDLIQISSAQSLDKDS